MASVPRLGCISARLENHLWDLVYLYILARTGCSNSEALRVYMKNEGGKEEIRNCEKGGSRGGHWAIARICDRGTRIRDTVRVGQLPLSLKVAVSQQWAEMRKA